MPGRLGLLATGGTLLLGWVALRALTPSGEVGSPSTGVVADLDTSLVTPWTEIARLPADEIETGRIVGLDARGDTLFVLQQHHWRFIVGGSPSAVFGTDSRGAPSWIGRGIAILAHDSVVTILDDLRQLATRWTLDGTRIAEQDLRSTRGLGSMHQRLTPIRGNQMLVTSVVPSEQGVEWVVTRLHSTEADTLITGHGIGARGGGHDEPHIAALGDGSFVVIDANTWRVRHMGADGATRRVHHRSDAPRWSFSDSARRSFNRTMALVGPTMQAALAIDATLPPVRAITATEDGRLIVLSAVTTEATHAELVALDGSPIASLWPRPEEHPVFLVRGALYRVRALDDVTLIERQRLNGAQP